MTDSTMTESKSVQWKLMPCEATQEMLDACGPKPAKWDSTPAGKMLREECDRMRREDYAAMFAASPQPQGKVPGREEIVGERSVAWRVGLSTATWTEIRNDERYCVANFFSPGDWHRECAANAVRAMNAALPHADAILALLPAVAEPAGEAPRREKCTYADRYKAKRAPTCGCVTCERKWAAARALTPRGQGNG